MVRSYVGWHCLCNSLQYPVFYHSLVSNYISVPIKRESYIVNRNINRDFDYNGLSGYLGGNYIFAGLFSTIMIGSQYVIFEVNHGSIVDYFFIPFLFSFSLALIGAYVKRRRGRKGRKAEKEVKQRAAEEARMKKLQDIISVSNSVPVQRIAQVLGMSLDDVWKRVFDWAKQFNFRIEAENLVFNEETVNEFITSLDAEFRKWGKDGKV